MKAAVTGWAWRTPLGVGVEPVVRRLLAGERAARPNPRFDGAPYGCPLAAPVEATPADSRHKRFLRRMGLHAVDVATEALRDAGGAGVPADRLGLFAGYGGLRAHWNDVLPALEKQEDGRHALWANGLRLLPPFWMLQHLSNNAHALIAADLGAKGEGVTYGGMNAGAQAMEGAIRALADRAIDAAIVVAYDTLLEPETLVDLVARGRACGAGLDSLAPPYDARAAGFVPGEAAAAILLRRPEDVPVPRALVAASASAGDGSPEAVVALGMRLGAAAIVDGAGFAEPRQDRRERDALAKAGARTLLCLASATGHLGAATAPFQTIALASLLARRMLPPIAGNPAVAAGTPSPLTAAAPDDGDVALGLAAGDPALSSAVRVEVPRVNSPRV